MTVLAVLCLFKQTSWSLLAAGEFPLNKVVSQSYCKSAGVFLCSPSH